MTTSILRECREILKRFVKLGEPEPEGACSCWWWDNEQRRQSVIDDTEYTPTHLPDCWLVAAQAVALRLTEEAIEQDEKRRVLQAKITQAAIFAFRNRATNGPCKICKAKWLEGGHDVSNHETWCGYRAIKEAAGDAVWLTVDGHDQKEITT